MERKGYTLNSLTLLFVLSVVAFCTVYASGVVFVRSAAAQESEAIDDKVLVTSDDQSNFVGDEKVKFEEVGSGEAQIEPSSKEVILAKIRKNWDSSIDKMPSLFFTYWQHQSIIDAKNTHGKVRPPTEAELRALEEEEDDLNLDPERRYITLGGIVYKAENDWTIWLNGQRVTPDAVPKQVLDLRVYKDYIEVKWLDDYTNSIFPLRLRAHQRFNMDMRIFLPG